MVTSDISIRKLETVYGLMKDLDWESKEKSMKELRRDFNRRLKYKTF